MVTIKKHAREQYTRLGGVAIDKNTLFTRLADYSLGIPDTNLSGRSTRIARNVRRSTSRPPGPDHGIIVMNLDSGGQAASARTHPKRMPHIHAYTHTRTHAYE